MTAWPDVVLTVDTGRSVGSVGAADGNTAAPLALVGYPFDCHLASAQVPDQHRWLPGVGRRVREWQ